MGCFRELINSLKPNEFLTSRIALDIFLCCLVGFFINCQPSEPYLTVYCEKYKNVTATQLDEYVWPVEMYSLLATGLPIGLAAEFVGFAPIILLGLVFRVATRTILLWARGVVAMAIMQVTYAGATAANTIYFAYIYQVVPHELFGFATGCVYASYHLGNLVGSLLSELIYAITTNLKVLFYVSLGFTLCGVISFFFVPAPDTRETPETLFKVLKERKGSLKDVGKELFELYNHRVVVQWTVWWIFGHGGAGIIINYYQLQFTEVQKRIDPDDSPTFGFAEVGIEAAMVVGALTAHFAWKTIQKAQSIVICVTSFATAVLWFCSTFVKTSIGLSYFYNILAWALDAFQVSAASGQIAISTSSPRYGIIFPLNAFLSYLLGSIVQLVGQGQKLTWKQYYYIGTGLELMVVLFVAVLAVWVRGFWGPAPRNTGRLLSQVSEGSDTQPLVAVVGSHLHVDRG